jgi:hypothetical protein
MSAVPSATAVAAHGLETREPLKNKGWNR